MKFFLLINFKLLTIANSFLRNIAGHELFSAYKYEKCQLLLTFLYLIAEKLSCSVELGINQFSKPGPECTETPAASRKHAYIILTLLNLTFI